MRSTDQFVGLLGN